MSFAFVDLCLEPDVQLDSKFLLESPLTSRTSVAAVLSQYRNGTAALYSYSWAFRVIVSTLCGGLAPVPTTGIWEVISVFVFQRNRMEGGRRQVEVETRLKRRSSKHA